MRFRRLWLRLTLIGVFDSGVGGLTVLKALRDHLPAEPFVYLGDTARLPYGTKSGDTIVRYAVQAASLLAGEGIDLLVVACNTASAYALPALAAQFPHIPVIGVIEPGALAAATASRSGRIAILCTESTARAGAYQSAIAKARPDAVVTAIACPLLVGLAEEGWIEGDVPQAVAAHYLADVFADPATAPDTIVLGCTHFPLLRRAIEAACPADVTIIDSGVTTAQFVTTLLPALPHGQGVNLRFLATDGTDRFARVAQYFLGHAVESSAIELVNL